MTNAGRTSKSHLLGHFILKLGRGGLSLGSVSPKGWNPGAADRCIFFVMKGNERKKSTERQNLK